MRTWGLLWPLTLTLFMGSVSAKSRLVRHFDQRSGLPVSWVASIAQDEGGFLWIGTSGGLVRWDGRTMQTWGRETSIGLIDLLVTSPGGEVIAREHPENRLYRVTPSGLGAVLGPSGESVLHVRDMTFDADGSLYAVMDETLFRWKNGTWTDVSGGLAEGERPLGLGSGSGGAPLLITTSGVHEIKEAAVQHLLLQREGVLEVLGHPDGSLFLLQGEYPCRLLRWVDGIVEEKTVLQDRPVGMALRDTTVWASFSRNLVAIRPDGTTEQLGAHDDFRKTAGPILVDAEGSLWLGNYLGLFQFPEPDTVMFNTADGLPGEQTRFLTQAGEELWVATWSGMAVLDRRGRLQPKYRHPALMARDIPCRDGDGRLWFVVSLDEGTSGVRPAVLERIGSVDSIHELANRPLLGRCAGASDGTVWIPAGSRILSTPPGGGAPLVGAVLPEEAWYPRVLLEDRSGRLWAAPDGKICHAPVARAADPNSWVCESLAGPYQVKALIETPSGAIWAASSGGVLRRVQDSWETIPASLRLPSNWVHNLVSSPAGGIWVTGHGSLLRVQEQPESDSGWEVLESPGAWHGIPMVGGGDVYEAGDQSLWLTTSAGLVHVPRAARAAQPAPPKVRLVDVHVDGKRLPMSQQADLPYERNRLELSFAALSFRDPALIRYKIRSGPDAPWVESRQPGFRFFDLPPGEYQPEMIASLDGDHWSAEAARFQFTVRPPWYRHPGFMTAFAVALAALLYSAYRVRVAVLLRLERQRTRIAMDLHDELGAGLGSIGLLADLVADDRVGEDERKNLSGKISETADELGSGLTDIIWTLRSKSEPLSALGVYLRERGQRMVPSKSGVRFTYVLPEVWPDIRLSLAVRRNLQRIAVEAMHNAVRHGKPSRIELGMAPAGIRWLLWVEDDGCGMPDETASPEGKGLGLESIKERAAAIGGVVTWGPGREGGTRMEIVFDPA